MNFPSLSLPALAGVSGLVDLQLAGCLEPLEAARAGVGPRGGVASQVGGQVGPAGTISRAVDSSDHCYLCLRTRPQTGQRTAPR